VRKNNASELEQGRNYKEETTRKKLQGRNYKEETTRKKKTKSKS
jgi:hypothetical protein